MLGIPALRDLFTPVLEPGDFLAPELEDPESYIEAGDTIGFESAAGKPYKGTVRRYDSDRYIVVFEYYHSPAIGYIRGEKSPDDLWLIEKHA